MTDRELIELAAKAEGRQIAWDARGAFTVINGISGGDTWNPLESVADAFRLAVKLQMRVHVFAGCVYVDGDCQDFEESVGGGFPCAPTRRAITRAAAEIGKAM